MRQTRPQTRRPDRRTFIVPASVLVAVCLLTSESQNALAQYADPSEISREYTIKAAFVYNFGRYVQWPPKAFVDPQNPFVIGLLGPSPIGTKLDDIAKTKTIANRPIHIRQPSLDQDIQGCQILFFPAEMDPKKQAEAVYRCRGIPVLLIGENQDFVKQAGMIALTIEQNKVQVYVNLKAAQREGLQVSSKLLQVSQIVE